MRSVLVPLPGAFRRRVVSVALGLAMLGDSTVFAQRVLLDAVSAKQALTQRGIGKWVRITESDGTSVTGVLTALDDDSFEVTPRKATAPATIAYTQVTEVHKDKAKTSHPRNNQGVAIVVGVVVVGAIVAAVVFVVTHPFNIWGG